MTNETQYSYSGTDLLLSAETALERYNAWIVKRFVHYFQSHTKGNPAVMDFGAGVGTLAAVFKKITGVQPLAVEADADHRSALKIRGYATYSSVQEVPTGMTFIYSSNVLEHIEDDVSTLRELYYKLSPGGGIAIYVPAFESIRSRFDNKVGHYRRYTIETLSKNLAAAGFIVEDMRYCDSVGFILAMLFKWICPASDEPSVASLRFFDRVVFPMSKLLDLFVHKLWGKNVLAYARRAAGPTQASVNT